MEMGISKKSLWQRISVSEKRWLTVWIIITATLIALTIFFTIKWAVSEKPCDTPECITASAQIINSIDVSADPCDNFFKFACGNYIKHSYKDPKLTPIQKLTIETKRQLDEIIKQPNKTEDSFLTKTQNHLLQLCMDTNTLNTSLNTFKSILRKVNGWPVLDEEKWNERSFEWRNMTYALKRLGCFSSLLYITSISDPLDKEKYIIHIMVPDKSYIKEKYYNTFQTYFSNIAVLFGANEKKANIEAEEVLKFTVLLDKVVEIDEYLENETLEGIIEDMQNRRQTIEDFQKENNQINWLEFINGVLYPSAKLSGSDYVIFPKKKFISAFFDLLERTPKRVQANHMIWTLVDTYIDFLPKEFQEVKKNYDCATNVRNTDDRYEVCKQILEHSFHVLPARMDYVKKYLSIEKKEKVRNIFKSIKSEFLSRIQSTDWLDNESKHKFVEKVNEIKEVIGIPEKKVYSETIKLQSNYNEDSLLDLYLNRMKIKTDALFSQITIPTDYSRLQHLYGLVTQVNAFYSIEDNEIVLPGGLLQGIFFDTNRPMYLNFGALGSIIGHELTHSVCEDANKIDKNGKWKLWTKQTETDYIDKTKCIIEEAETFNKGNSKNKINSTKTVEENVADFTGISTAYTAYKRWVQQNGNEPKLFGVAYTHYQLFWISSAAWLCYENYKDNDIHSYTEFRVNAPLRNNPDFVEDFNCPKDSKMNALKKCKIF